jgi:hypothetical protein
MFKTISLLFVSAIATLAQPLSVGLKLGVPATDAFKVVTTQSIASSQHFTWGPYLELRLPGGNGIEIDALRRSYDVSGISASTLISQSASSWEFPVVIKHRIGEHLIRPYFEGGASFSRLSDIKLSTLQHRSNYGLVAGGGVEFNLLFFKVSPEVRWTGWALRNFDGSVQTNRNQFAVLMGFGF